MARRGVDIQLHTHRDRTPMDRVEFWRDVEENRRLIEEIAGRPSRGISAIEMASTMRLFSWMRELGVISALACEPSVPQAR